MFWTEKDASYLTPKQAERLKVSTVSILENVLLL